MRRKAAWATVGGAVFCAAVALPARADVADECITESETGQRLLLARHFVESRPHLVACGRAECPNAVVQDCADRLRQAEAAMATVLLVAKRPDGSNAEGAAVFVDDSAAPAPLSGVALEMNPGPHTFRFELPGALAIVRRVTVEEGARRQDVTVTFAPSPRAPGAATSSNARRTLALVVGGAGAAALAAGTLFVAMAAVYQSKEVTDCNGLLNRCANTATATHDFDTAGALADASTVALVAGATLLGTGIVLWLSAPRPAASGVRVVPRMGGLTLHGDF